tara:strand:- start:116 stop:1150 length:1035 start_codon:yes stop_codon:yes gene_type:complete
MRLFFTLISYVYGFIISIRNLFFDIKIFKSESFKIPIIGIGNLSIGGTGKTPHVEYIINLLKIKYNVAVVSRGYGRKNYELKYVMSDSNAIDVGDEPLQIKKKHKDILSIVSGSRKKAIKKILDKHKEIDVILLDDAFQHRWVNLGLSILLTTFDNPFYNDKLLPLGRLREQIHQSNRADLIIITKSPKNLDNNQKKIIQNHLSKNNEKPIFFSSIRYKKIISCFGHNEREIKTNTSIFLITGIANSKPLTDKLKKNIIHHFKFKDHHYFTKNEILNIISLFIQNNKKEKIILTTEKDMLRIVEYKQILKNIPIFYIPIEINFYNNLEFNNKIINYVEENKRNC